MIRISSILILLLSVSLFSFGQDYRYSQFYNAPLLLNPAFAGDHKDHFRMFLNYKDQWSSISNSFKTASGSFDMPAFEDVESVNKFGFGLSFLSDKAGTTNYGFNNINLSIARHTKVSNYSRLSGGVNLGYGQSQADLNDVKWESQHNGNNYDPSLPSGEAVFVNKITYLDAGVGLVFTALDPANDRKYVLGISANHLNFPNHSFIGQYQNRLKPKLLVHGEMEFGYTYFMLKPKFIIMNQGPTTSFTLGGLTRFRVGSQPDSRFTDVYVGSAFEIGAFYRFDESVIFVAQYEFKHNLMIGLSYDIIVSDLAAASAAGGYELALRYQGLFGNNRIKIKKDIDGDGKDKGKKRNEKAKPDIRM